MKKKDVGISIAVGALGSLASLVVGVNPDMFLNVALSVLMGAGMGGGFYAFTRGMVPKRREKVEETGNTAEMISQISEVLSFHRSTMMGLSFKLESESLQTFRMLTELIDSARMLLSTSYMTEKSSYDGDVSLMRTIAENYIPEMINNLKKNNDFIRDFDGRAKRTALQNLSSMEAQMTILEEAIDRVEEDMVTGVSRSIEAHGEFLKERFASQNLDAYLDLDLKE